MLVDGAVLRECHEGWKAVVADGFQQEPRPLIHRGAWDMLKKSKVIDSKKKEILQEAVAQRQNVCIPEALASLEKVLSNVKMLDEAGYEQHLVCLWAPRAVVRRRGEARQAQEGKTFSMKDYVYSVTSCCKLAEHFVKNYSALHCTIMTTDRFPNLVLCISELREYARMAAETDEAAMVDVKALGLSRLRHAGRRVILVKKLSDFSDEGQCSQQVSEAGRADSFTPSEFQPSQLEVPDIDENMVEPLEEPDAQRSRRIAQLDAPDELETVLLKRRIAELEAQTRTEQARVKELERELERELRASQRRALAATSFAICTFVAFSVNVRAHWHRLLR